VLRELTEAEAAEERRLRETVFHMRDKVDTIAAGEQQQDLDKMRGLVEEALSEHMGGLGGQIDALKKQQDEMRAEIAAMALHSAALAQAVRASSGA
jgi:hypothetical protein